MELSRTVAYAIRATVELAQMEPNCPIPGREIASRGEMPERFLVQVLHALVLSGVLRSTRGMSGGYYLARDPNTITLLDILESFDHPLKFGVPEQPSLTASVHS